MLFFEHTGQRLAILVLKHHEEPMIVFEQLIYFGHGRMVYFFEFVDLLLELLSLMAADFVLVDDVDCTGECGFSMDGFAEFIELVLLETGGE